MTIGLFKQPNNNSKIERVYNFASNISKDLNEYAKSHNSEIIPFVMPSTLDTKWVVDLYQTIRKLTNSPIVSGMPLKEQLNAGQSIGDFYDPDFAGLLDLLKNAATKYTKALCNPDVKKGILRTRRINLMEFVYEYNTHGSHCVMGRSLALYWHNTELPIDKPKDINARRIWSFHVLNKAGVTKETLSDFVSFLEHPECGEERLQLFESMHPFADWYFQNKVPANPYIKSIDDWFKMFFKYVQEKWSGYFQIFPRPIIDNPDKKMFRHFLLWLQNDWGVTVGLENKKPIVAKKSDYVQSMHEMSLMRTDYKVWKETVFPKL